MKDLKQEIQNWMVKKTFSQRHINSIFFSEKSAKYENTLYEESDIYKDESEEAQVSSCRRIFEQHFKIF